MLGVGVWGHLYQVTRFLPKDSFLPGYQEVGSETPVLTQHNPLSLPLTHRYSQTYTSNNVYFESSSTFRFLRLGVSSLFISTNRLTTSVFFPSPRTPEESESEVTRDPWVEERTRTRDTLSDTGSF